MDRREYKQMMEQIRPAPELMERVLAEGQTERSRPMKHRIRAAGVAALAAALLMGTALAVNSRIFGAVFQGRPERGGALYPGARACRTGNSA